MATTNTTKITMADLSNYDLLQRQWAANLINEKVSALGKVLNLKGRKDNVDALNAITDAKPGDVWMIGAEDAEAFEEYYRTETNKWEYMGVTRVSLEGYVTETVLYKGAEGTGTAEAPATGTVLASIDTRLDTLETTLGDTDIETMFNTNTGTINTSGAPATPPTEETDPQV